MYSVENRGNEVVFTMGDTIYTVYHKDKVTKAPIYKNKEIGPEETIVSYDPKFNKTWSAALGELLTKFHFDVCDEILTDFKKRYGFEVPFIIGETDTQ